MNTHVLFTLVEGVVNPTSERQRAIADAKLVTKREGDNDHDDVGGDTLLLDHTVSCAHIARSLYKLHIRGHPKLHHQLNVNPSRRLYRRSRHLAHHPPYANHGSEEGVAPPSELLY